MEKMDLELEIIFDGSDVEKSMTEGEVADHPADDLFEKARFGAPTVGGVDPQLLDTILGAREVNKASGVADFSWDSPITSAQLEKRGSMFTKGTVGYRLGIARIEEKEINGELWIHGFDAAGTLVDARLAESFL